MAARHQSACPQIRGTTVRVVRDCVQTMQKIKAASGMKRNPPVEGKLQAPPNAGGYEVQHRLEAIDASRKKLYSRPVAITVQYMPIQRLSPGADAMSIVGPRPYCAGMSYNMRAPDRTVSLGPMYAPQ